jgi:hypothetical protein
MFVSGNPNHKGNVAEAAIAFAATKLGIPVYKPVAEHGRADLVFEIGDCLMRVQCKSGKLDRAAAVIAIPLRSSYLTPNGYVRTTYSEREIDLLAAYCHELDRSYLLPATLVAGRTGIQLRLTPPKNRQRSGISLASEFEFQGAVAQLEERLAGSEEARGSSPLSSIAPDEQPTAREVGCNKFRDHFGYYLDRAAEGDDILVKRYGKPYVRLTAAVPRLPQLRAAMPESRAA